MCGKGYFCIRFRAQARKTSFFWFDHDLKIESVNTLSYRTTNANNATVERAWFVVDAAGETVGRLSSRVAAVLRGKHKPSYTPHVDTGDNVIIINADQVVFSGSKEVQKTYLTHSGYPGGQKSNTPERIRAKHPERILETAIRGMLPKNKLGRAMFKKLHVYAGAEHPHIAQKPADLPS